MKTLLQGLAAVAVSLVCASPAQATSLLFIGDLDASQVVAGSTSTATGTASVVIDTVAMTLTTDLSWSGLTGVSDRAHVHSGLEGSPTDGIFFHEVIWDDPVSVDGGFVACWWDPTDISCAPATGSLHNVLDISNGYYNCPDFQCIVDTAVPNGFYIDMHTELYPSGEIRGQLILAEPTPVPEPGTGILVLLGVGLIARGRRTWRKDVGATAPQRR